MARGNEAKEAVTKKLQEAFGADFIGIYDKKIYVWAKENGERIQIALSMTCPKTPIGSSEMDAAAASVKTASGDWNFETPTTRPVVDFTPEEKERIAALIKQFDL